MSKGNKDGGKKKEKKTKGKKVKDALKKLERKPFKVTKLPNTDDFFSKIQAPMDTLCDLSDAVADANEGICGLVESDEDLKKAKIERTVPGVCRYMLEEGRKSGNDFFLTIGDNGIPSVDCKEEPQGLVGKIFNAVKKLFEAIKTIITESPDLVGQVQDAVEASKDFPSNASNDATSSGLNPLETGVAVKNVGVNCKYLAGFPNDIAEFIKNMKELVETLKGIFEKKEGEGEKKEGEGEKKELAE